MKHPFRVSYSNQTEKEEKPFFTKGGHGEKMKKFKRHISFIVALLFFLTGMRTQVYATNDPYISVTLVDTNIMVDGLNRYEIIIHTHAGDLETTYGTKFFRMEIKTSSNGILLEEFRDISYYYNGTPNHYESVGYFDLSEDQLTEAYIKITGVRVLNYDSDWLSIYGYSGTVAINSTSSSLVDG